MFSRVCLFLAGKAVYDLMFLVKKLSGKTGHLFEKISVSNSYLMKLTEMAINGATSIALFVLSICSLCNPIIIARANRHHMCPNQYEIFFSP
jgi:hypothetical protein